MSVGDLLEWIAACMLVAAAYLWLGLPSALIAGVVSLFYLAQNLANVPLRRRRDEEQQP